MSYNKNIKKVLLLGSGALKIGQAGEFDYSGSQALKALKEEGITTVLINPNIATIQTSQSLADKIYFLPVTEHFVKRVIAQERPDGIMLSFGGQTALNCGLKLSQTGVFKKYGVRVLGTPVKSIELTEDRKLFAQELAKINVTVAQASYAKSVPEALRAAKTIGYPMLIRSGFSLGGLGSAVLTNEHELLKAATTALKNAPQISLEAYLKHWKEVEYEVVRDANGNKITVCNMENLDPLGIHTGESIVVAPSQTLNNYQYHMLREISLTVIEHLKIVGECNIQFALDPKSYDYKVIEVNARLSRSSALASKATGYPLAYVAAKLALGKDLPSLKNRVTGVTSAFFEPALDYIVIKIPRWDLQKFTGVGDEIGSEMKSVGEVMAIGRSFEEVLQKALRMLETGQDGFLQDYKPQARDHKPQDSQYLEKYLAPSTKRLFGVASQLADGASVAAIYKATGIDPWFLHHIARIVAFEKKLLTKSLPLAKETIQEAKALGFSDKLLAKYFEKPEAALRASRIGWGITPKVKHIDTLAAEYPAKTNYLYVTYHATESETVDIAGKKAIVLGSGPYRIGSSVEFDWCSVTAAQTLKEKGLTTAIINCNPETVSTDFDTADKLYFEELSFERVADIYDIEQDATLVLAFGGQIPNSLALPCYNAKFSILGTSPLSIDQAEDRHKFSDLLDTLGIDQPPWQQVKNIAEAAGFANTVGYPVLIRPSYVLSGSAMNVAFSELELKGYIEKATRISQDHPVVISKFINNAKEIEIDGVAVGGKLHIYAISEHIENAGVHSGDATLVLPPQRLFLETVRQIKKATKKIVAALNITGPFNIQYLAKNNNIMVIELNLRASRSFPFVSKVTGYNFVTMATKAMLGDDISGKYNTVDIDYVGVKASQFSFNRIKGADPKLRVEMSSTGEVACFGGDLEEAYLKALLATGFRIPKRSVLLSIGGEANKLDFLESAHILYALGLRIYATENTSQLLKQAGIPNTLLHKISQSKHPSVLDALYDGKIDLAINISIPQKKSTEKDGFLIRRTCIDYNIPLVTNLQTAIALTNALCKYTEEALEVKSWDTYLKADE